MSIGDPGQPRGLPLLPEDEDRLTRLAQEGDRAAFERLYDAYFEGIFDFAARLTGSDDAAIQVTAATFQRVLETRLMLGEADRIGVRLFTVARDQIGRLGSLPPQEPPAPIGHVVGDPASGPAPVRFDPGGTAGQVWAAVADLSEPERAALHLAARHGLTIEEIGHVLGVPPFEADRLIGSATAGLRDRLAGRVEDPIGLFGRLAPRFPPEGMRAELWSHLTRSRPADPGPAPGGIAAGAAPFLPLDVDRGPGPAVPPTGPLDRSLPVTDEATIPIIDAPGFGAEPTTAAGAPGAAEPAGGAIAGPGDPGATGSGEAGPLPPGGSPAEAPVSPGSVIGFGPLPVDPVTLPPDEAATIRYPVPPGSPPPNTGGPGGSVWSPPPAPDEEATARIGVPPARPGDVGAPGRFAEEPTARIPPAAPIDWGQPPPAEPPPTHVPPPEPEEGPRRAGIAGSVVLGLLLGMIASGAGLWFLLSNGGFLTPSSRGPSPTASPTRSAALIPSPALVTQTATLTATAPATASATTTRTASPTATGTLTPTLTATATLTPTRTAAPATATAVPPTATAVPPTATAVSPTATAVPPTPTATQPPPTSTATALPPTPTAVPPIVTPTRPPNTPTVPAPTPTATAAPPTIGPTAPSVVGGALEVRPGEVVFNEGEVTRSVGITNRGRQPIGWQAGTSAPWISLQPAGGIVPPGDTETLGIVVRREGLTPGTHRGAVVITTETGRVELPVVVTVR